MANPFLMKDFEGLMNDIRQLCLNLGSDADCRKKFEVIQDQFYAFSENLATGSNEVSIEGNNTSTRV